MIERIQLTRRPLTDAGLLIGALLLVLSAYVVEYALLLAVGDPLYSTFRTQTFVRLLTVPVSGGIVGGFIAAVCLCAGLRRRALLYATIVFIGSVVALLVFPVFTTGELA